MYRMPNAQVVQIAIMLMTILMLVLAGGAPSNFGH